MIEPCRLPRVTRSAARGLVWLWTGVVMAGCPTSEMTAGPAAPAVDIVLSFDGERVPQPLDVNTLDIATEDLGHHDDATDADDDTGQNAIPDTQSTASFERDVVVVDAMSDTSPPEPVCTFDQDCRACAFPTAPTSAESCYCILCAIEILPNATCDANARQWESVCNAGAWPEGQFCPTPRCLGAPAGACDADRQCVPACDLAMCPTPGCPVEEQVLDFGSCCPRCAGPSSCRSGRDCDHCNYMHFVAGPEACYCPTCDTVPLSTAECDANRASWENHCSPWPTPSLPCLDVLCPVKPAPPECLPTGECSNHRDSCRRAQDCTACAFETLPQSPGDCACPGCPVARSQQHCEAILDATALHCTNFDYAACPQVDCVPTDPSCPMLGGLCELMEILPR